MLSLCLLSTSCKKDSQAPAGDPSTSGNVRTPKTEAAYELVWSDEFDGTSLNTSKWNYENGNLGVNN